MTTFAQFKRDVDKMTDYDEEIEYIGDDGLIHCKQCGEPKQYLMEADKDCPYQLIQQKAAPRLCKCERDLADAQRLRQVAEEVKRRTESTRRECFGDSGYISATFDTSDGGGEQFDKCRVYAEHFSEMRPDGILLYGTVGTGKTHMAACIANRVIDDGFTAKFTSVARISGMVTGAYGNINVLDGLSKYDLVVIDDLGADGMDEKARSRLFHVVDDLTDKGTAIVITTNLNLTANQDIQSPEYRTYSRILGNCIRVKFAGDDLRKKQGAEKLSKFREFYKQATEGKQTGKDNG